MILTFFFATQFDYAQKGIALKFAGSGTASESVQVSVVNTDGVAVDGVNASIQCSHEFKATAGT